LPLRKWQGKLAVCLDSFNASLGRTRQTDSLPYPRAALFILSWRRERHEGSSVIIVFAAKAAEAPSLRAAQPAVFGEILVELLLGPTAIDLLRLLPCASECDMQKESGTVSSPQGGA
jgi:hypothetical protein